MPQYLVQVSYTAETVATLVANPQDRIAVVAKAVKKLGGKVIDGWLSFGEYDAVVITQLPDNVAAAAFSMAIGAGGACKSIRTTPLLSVAEGMSAMKAASTTGYKPASSS